jgi:[ribosomal protein S5]-alanine N-acetyltransferase
VLTLPTTRTIDAPPVPVGAAHFETIQTDWRQMLPVLSTNGVTVRNLRASDAATLHAMLTTDEVARFITPPPTTVEGFEKFIDWTRRQQAAGRYVCFGIVPDGQTHAVGIVQVRALDSGFELAEWGFALGSAFWGTGVFQSAARAVLGFVFAELPVNRIEARAVTQNGRGNGALQKVGARFEAILRQSFRRDGVRMDQVLWSILREDWLSADEASDERDAQVVH